MASGISITFAIKTAVVPAAEFVFILYLGMAGMMAVIMTMFLWSQHARNRLANIPEQMEPPRPE